MAELEKESWGDFTGFMRMEPAIFHEILMRLNPSLTKVDNNWQKTLEPGLNLAMMLCFFATSNSLRDLALSFLIPYNSITMFLCDFCETIIRENGTKW